MYFTALLGNPVAHSVSPELYGCLATYFGLEYVHLKLCVPTKHQLPDYLRALVTLGCQGINVTIPYKVIIKSFLDELDDSSASVGAVNTIQICKDKLIGYNTDSIGSYRAIQTGLRPVNTSDTAVVLGAGGAARAIVSQLCIRGVKIYMLTPWLYEETPFRLDVDPYNKYPIIFLELTDENLKNVLCSANFLINATPVGMSPDADRSLLSLDVINHVAQYRGFDNLCVFDAVFNPVITKLIKDTRDFGAKTCSGLWMLIYQGLESFRIWTDVNIGALDMGFIRSLYDSLNESLSGTVVTNYCHPTVGDLS